MDVGMLWFDNDQKSNLQERVQRAADYYARKYGKKPNLCFVHPSMLPQPVEIPANGNGADRLKAGAVEVRSSNSLLPNHFWIGVERQEVHAALA
jgi:hypothetical protein